MSGGITVVLHNFMPNDHGILFKLLPFLNLFISLKLYCICYDCV